MMTQANESNATWVSRSGSNRIRNSPKLAGGARAHKLTGRLANQMLDAEARGLSDGDVRSRWGHLEGIEAAKSVIEAAPRYISTVAFDESFEGRASLLERDRRSMISPTVKAL